MTVRTIGAREARNNLSQILGEVHFGGHEVIIERSGKPMVAVIGVDEYRRLVAEREARFQVLDAIRRRLPNLPPEEVMQDVTEAIAAIRTDHAARRP